MQTISLMPAADVDFEFFLRLHEQTAGPYVEQVWGWSRRTKLSHQAQRSLCRRTPLFGPPTASSYTKYDSVGGNGPPHVLADEHYMSECSKFAVRGKHQVLCCSVRCKAGQLGQWRVPPDVVRAGPMNTIVAVAPEVEPHDHIGVDVWRGGVKRRSSRT